MTVRKYQNGEFACPGATSRALIRHWLALGAATAIVIYATAQAWIAHLQKFPINYSWSDLLLSYRGGFIRRGLLGEIAYQLSPLISAKYFLAGAAIACHFTVIAWLVLLSARTRTTIGLMFLLSPGTLLFSVYDPVVFGRKDFIIIAAFGLSAFIISRFSRNTALALLLLTYAISGLIIETAWLYFPLALSLLLIAHNGANRWQIIAGAIGAIFLAACIGLMFIFNHSLTYIGEFSATQRAIVESWQAIYPDAYLERGAEQYLGFPARDGFWMAVGHHLNPVSIAAFITAFALANIPALMATADRPAMPASLLTRLAAGAGLIAMLSTFAAGADWGRYISSFAIHAFAFAILTRSSTKDTPKAKWPIIASVLLVALYATTWEVKHFRFSGISALVPGPAFRILGVQVAP